MDSKNIRPMSDDNQTLERASDVGLTAFKIKMIAIISMLIDHIGAGLIEPIILNSNGLGEKSLQFLVSLNFVMRAIGRLAFPIFCFFIVEGLFKTRSRFKYALRLAIFAVISELPFDIGLMGGIYKPDHNNVFFTLLIGLLMIW
nr:conjugal transfer protein TraX [Lachnospiraceae bacterium]